MRCEKGKLIAVWVPGNHGAGGSTLTNALGITLQHLTDRKTIIVNMGSSRNYLEQYMKKDVEIRFSMDYLKSFDRGLSADHIRTYASAINDMLYILPNCKISSEVTKVEENFSQSFLDRVVEAYEIVIVDLEAGLCAENQIILNKADIILAVMNENIIMLEDIVIGNAAIKEYIDNEKTLCLFNGLHDAKNDAKLLRSLNKRLGIGSSYGIAYDIIANKAACTEGKFYSYLKKELNRKKSDSTMPEQMKELCSIIMDKLFIPIDTIQENTGLLNLFFIRAKHWGEVDV
jgi:cellulose biosynthesis protein BcsQ